MMMPGNNREIEGKGIVNRGMPGWSWSGSWGVQTPNSDIQHHFIICYVNLRAAKSLRKVFRV